jgi:UrcA family protein
MQNRKSSFGVVAGLVTGLFVATLGTSAAAATDTSKIVVPYGDLNLSAAQGIEALYHRIQAAAQQVCVVLDGRTIQQRSQFDSCKLSAINNAVSDVAVPALSDYYNERNGIAHGGGLARKEVTVARRDNGHQHGLCLADI